LKSALQARLPQAQGRPIGLVGAAKPSENFSEHRPRERDPVFIEQSIHSTLFARTRFRKERGPNARVN
jgi:hypothetical protein